LDRKRQALCLFLTESTAALSVLILANWRFPAFDRLGNIGGKAGLAEKYKT